MFVKKDIALEKAGAYDEYNLWIRHNVITLLITLTVAFTTFHLILPIHVLLFVPDVDFSQRLDYVGEYFTNFGKIFTLDIPYKKFISGYYGSWIKQIKNDPTIKLPFVWIGWVSIFMITGIAGIVLNTHNRTPNIFGDSRWATRLDIMKMEKKSLIGFKTKLFLVGSFEKEYLRMGETLSVLLLAPPGTGKTVGFIVPAAVDMDQACLFFHDQKPELFDMTSGHRATVGPVFQLKWSAQDEPDGTWLTEEQAKLTSPELLDKDNQGNLIIDEMGRYKTKPIFFPSWNVLSPKTIPSPGPKRDMYIERLVNVLCPDPTGGGDKFWTGKARAALIGMIHYIVAKVEYATNPMFKGNWDDIPEQWVGKEASFPMMIDWFTYAQIKYDDGSDDPMRQLFKATLDTATHMDKEFKKVYGIHVLGRAIAELTSLMNSPDKTRGSILQTMDEALSSFKNEAVRQRTCYSDFAFYELRGMPIKEAKEREEKKVKESLEQGKIYKPRYKKHEYKPISLYISVSAEDAKAFATITGIFIDSANAYLVANGPNTIDDQGNQLGPGDFIFLIDEAPQLPKLDTVINGPAVGRSKRVSYIIVGQDFGQFEQKYSKQEVETLKSTTAIKIVLSQNNETAAKGISEMAGEITYTSYNISEKSGDPKNPFSGLIKQKSASESYQQTKFLKPSFIMSMPEDKHVVLVQGFMNRPLLCDTPKYFLNKDLAKKVYNLRDVSKNTLDITGKLYGPNPTTPMPVDQIADAQKRYLDRKKTETAIEETNKVLSDPRHVIIVTPEDIQSLTRSPDGTTEPLKKVYACAEIFIEENDGYTEEPNPDSIITSDSVAEISAYIGQNKYYIFNKKALDALNEKLRSSGQNGLNPNYAIFIEKEIIDIGEDAGDDIYYFGIEGPAKLMVPRDKKEVTPEFAITYTSEIINFILGIKDQIRIFAS